MGFVHSKPPRAKYQVQQVKSVRSVPIVGSREVGKKTFLYALKRILPAAEGKPFEYSHEKFNNDLLKVSSWIVLNIWFKMNNSERKQFEQLSPKLQKLFESDQSGESSEFYDKILKHHNDISELLLTWWNIPFFRNCFLTNYDNGRNPAIENVEEFILKMSSKELFFPLTWCGYGDLYFKGSLKRFEIPIDNLNSFLFEITRSTRESNTRWRHFPEDLHIVLYFISLSDYNQVCIEDDFTSRMNEGLNEANETLTSEWCRNCKKIIIFTKPDILKKKLRNGNTYTRELNHDIRSELDEIEECNDKVVVNSIVNEYLVFLKDLNIDSYHILNTTSDEEVKHVYEMIFSAHPVKRSFVSKCLLRPKKLRMQMVLYGTVLMGKLVDIDIISSHREQA